MACRSISPAPRARRDRREPLRPRTLPHVARRRGRHGGDGRADLARRREAQGDAPRLSEVVAALSKAGRGGHAALLTQWLDRLDATGRWALLKFLSGAPRVGVSARLAKQAVADAFGKNVDDIEELWHGLDPPYTELFDWLEQKAERPSLPPLRVPPADAGPCAGGGGLAGDDLEDFAAEWKWDGIRIQVAAKGGVTRLFSRTGDDIGQSLPGTPRPLQLRRRARRRIAGGAQWRGGALRAICSSASTARP